MKAFLLALVLVYSVLAVYNSNNGPKSVKIENQYIVVFHSNSSSTELDRHISKWSGSASSQGKMWTILRTYRIDPGFFGYAVQTTSDMISVIQGQNDVAYIEQDQTVHALQACSIQKNVEWNLHRVNEIEPSEVDPTYVYPTKDNEDEVNVYVIDTGIKIDHSDFAGRAIWGENYVDSNDNDCNGHGTHVASTVAGVTYGLAKKVKVVAVKVLDCQGSGTYSGVIGGIQFAGSKKKGVANLSLGGPISTAVNDAIANAVLSGVTMVVAAGNEDQDACNVSPASSDHAITVGATELGAEGDERAYFSNYGSCVDIFAPGVQIKAAWISSRTSTNTISGTSMASPHVAGIAALYLAHNSGATPTQIKNALASGATKGLIDMACTSSSTSCSKSPNLMLYSKC